MLRIAAKPTFQATIAPRAPMATQPTDVDTTKVTSEPTKEPTKEKEVSKEKEVAKDKEIELSNLPPAAKTNPPPSTGN